MEKNVMEMARARRAALLAELEKIDTFLRIGDDLFSDEWMQGDPIRPVRKATNLSSRKRADTKAIANLAEEAILEAGKPMPRGKLVEWMERKGTTIPSEDKPRYVGTILWRHSDRFENIDGRGYWLKGLPLPTTEEAEDLAFMLDTKAG